ncbi:MAG: hypothetical protein E7373_06450 [Clostridiales bacterium]|nr:hypothetical protein [Clostridiales bacterium]
MTDSLNFDGLSLKSNSALLSEIQSDLQAIYSPNGEEIDFSSSSPDGQFSQLLATIGTTHRELLASIYNATDPSKCDKAQQDSKYQLNYLFRKGGSYTTQNIAITATKTVTLQGLDGSYEDNITTAFTVSDDSGNLWYLIDTTTIFAGVSNLPFRAAQIGAIVPTIGTITNMLTIIDGIVSVNNTVGYTSLGVEEESVLDFRIRRDRSTANQSGNNADTIQGQILALNTVKDCVVWVNDTNTTDSTGTLAHYLWVIVDGGANTDIADIIYSNKGGCGTRGNITVPISTISAQTLNINFDRPNVIPLYVKFNIQTISGAEAINQPGIKKNIGENLIYNISEDAETSKVTAIASEAIDITGGGGYPLNVLISTGGSATASVSGSGITGADVDVVTFQTVLGNISTGNYVFTYVSDSWQFNANNIELEDYGITYTGTPQNNADITVAFTEGTWSEYIPVSSIADKFRTDENKIYITVI